MCCYHCWFCTGECLGMRAFSLKWQSPLWRALVRYDRICKAHHCLSIVKRIRKMPRGGAAHMPFVQCLCIHPPAPAQPDSTGGSSSLFTLSQGPEGEGSTTCVVRLHQRLGRRWKARAGRASSLLLSPTDTKKRGGRLDRWGQKYTEALPEAWRLMQVDQLYWVCIALADSCASA